VKLIVLSKVKNSIKYVTYKVWLDLLKGSILYISLKHMYELRFRVNALENY